MQLWLFLFCCYVVSLFIWMGYCLLCYFILLIFLVRLVVVMSLLCFSILFVSIFVWLLQKIFLFVLDVCVKGIGQCLLYVRQVLVVWVQLLVKGSGCGLGVVVVLMRNFLGRFSWNGEVWVCWYFQFWVYGGSDFGFFFCGKEVFCMELEVVWGWGSCDYLIVEMY